MKPRYMILAAMLAMPLFSLAADEDTVASRRIEMKDGSYIIIDANGTMSHYDSRRQPLKMAPGKLMEGKDGTVYEMRNNALWQRLWLRGTLRDPK